MANEGLIYVRMTSQIPSVVTILVFGCTEKASEVSACVKEISALGQNRTCCRVLLQPMCY